MAPNRDGRGRSSGATALFLRDALSYFGGWHDAKEDGDLYCVQPVDRWVRQLAAMCWSDVDTDQSAEKVARVIVRRCLEQGIDPIAFNKGAWFLGAHFQRLCGFFNIETTMRLSDTGTLKTEPIFRFDTGILKKAVGTLGKAESLGQVYPI